MGPGPSFFQVLRADTHQHAQTVRFQTGKPFKGRDIGKCLAQIALGLIHIQFAGCPSPEACRGEGERGLLEISHRAGQFRLPLEKTHQNVGIRNIPQQGDESAVEFLDAGIQLIVGGFDRPAVFTPKIEFPSQIGSLVPEWEIGLGNELAVGHGSAHAVLREAQVDRLVLREKAANGNAELGPGSHDPIPRLAQGEILVCRLADQAFQVRIIEDLPPIAMFTEIAADPLVFPIDPILGDRSGGPGILGAHLVAVVDIFTPVGAPGSCKKCPCGDQSCPGPTLSGWFQNVMAVHQTAPSQNPASPGTGRMAESSARTAQPE